jgi:hypothetical protein
MMMMATMATTTMMMTNQMLVLVAKYNQHYFNKRRPMTVMGRGMTSQVAVQYCRTKVFTSQKWNC